MPPRRPWTDAHDAELRQHHAAGKSLHGIAKEMGRAKSTVAAAAERLDLSWDRDKVAKATQAKVLDARARRARAVEVELDLLETSQEQIRAGLAGVGWKTLQRAEGGAEDVVTLEFVPARDLREHTAARSAMAGIITRLDHTDLGVEAGRSMLDALAASLGVTGPTDT